MSPTPEQAWTLDDIPDLTGKTVVVTGANSGLGLLSARELARRGATVVMACRSACKAAAAKAQILTEIPAAALEIRCLDLGDLSTIEAFAADWDAGPIDVLINNAGIALGPYRQTRDGFESDFGVNHLGTFALTGRLLPHLLSAPEPRVVTVTSEGHHFVDLDFDKLNTGYRYNPAAPYWRSKKANLYFGRELQRRAALHGSPLRSLVAVPGGYSPTNVLLGGANEGRGALWRSVFRVIGALIGKPPIEGAWAMLRAATDPEMLGGSYIAPRGRLEFYGPPVERGGGPGMYDRAGALRLWSLSEQLTGVEYRFPGTEHCIPAHSTTSVRG